MNVLLAFDKFKDSMTANEACACATEALEAEHPDWHIDRAPLTDGGEGFAEILTTARGGQLRSVEVRGPRGQKVQAKLGTISLDALPERLTRFFSPQKTGLLAIADMASASGLALLEPDLRDPWQASSYGTGELIAAANAFGAEALLLGVGGSATNDLGLGALCAMGLRWRKKDGSESGEALPPARWDEIGGFAGRAEKRPKAIRIACDVDNPLLGPRGATFVYGPQKGLRAEDRDALESQVGRVARLLASHLGKTESSLSAPGAGAAGGMAFGLSCGTEAELLPGFDLVANWLALEQRIRNADIVLTGEGRFDESSLRGKGPGAIAALAKRLGREVHVFAGKTEVKEKPPGISLHAITPEGFPLSEALAQGPEFLFASVRRLFRTPLP